MAVRKGPASRASDHAPGTRRKGKDGKMWEVVVTKGGIQRWMRSSSARKHETRCSLKLRVTRYKGRQGRKSPAVSATSLPVGTRRRGLDGNMWRIVRAMNGIPRWQLIR